MIMYRTILPVLPCLIAALFSSCAASKTFQTETIIALERAALDRWGKGDPQGYIETFAPEITYFDPFQEARVDGLAAMKDFLIPFNGKIKVDRYEMIKPNVDHRGEVAILTYRLDSHGKGPNGEPRITRWNSTAVYGLVDGKWKIVHSHWSFTKP